MARETSGRHKNKGWGCGGVKSRGPVAFNAFIVLRIEKAERVHRADNKKKADRMGEGDGGRLQKGDQGHRARKQHQTCQS